MCKTCKYRNKCSENDQILAGFGDILRMTVADNDHILDADTVFALNVDTGFNGDNVTVFQQRGRITGVQTRLLVDEQTDAVAK